MPGIYRDLVQFRYHPVNAEGLIPQLAFLYRRRNRLRSGAFPVIKHQIGGGHVSVFSIWRGYLVPAAVCFGHDLHHGTVLIAGQDFVFRARPGTEPERAFPGFRTGEISVHPPDFRSAVVARRGEVHAWRHCGWNWSAEDAALYQPLPFSGFIDGMHQLQFIFAVQGFRHVRGQRRQGAVSVGGKVGAVGGIDTDHGNHLQS